jgi:predicted nucleic acid-binding protein
VKLIDLNLLLYAHHAAAKEHEPALAWLTQLFAGQEAIGLSWVTLRIGCFGAMC